MATPSATNGPTGNQNELDAIHRDIVSKARDIITAAQNPFDHATSMLTTMAQSTVIRLLLSLNVLSSIPISDTGITLTALSNATGVQAALLERLLRVVVGCGFILLNKDDGTYKHSPLSKGYAHGMLGDFFSAVYDECTTVWMLPEYFKSHEPAREPDGEDSATRNPDTWRRGQEGKMTTFEIMETEPSRLKNFHTLLVMAERIRPWTGFYDFGKLVARVEGTDDERPVLVDIGGGNGTMIAKVLADYPSIKPEQCILQDREDVIAMVKEQNTASLPTDVQSQAYNFFTPQPIKGARAYHFRAIFHDWSDAVVVKLLKNVVPSMAPDSKILIADNVLPSDGTANEMGAMMDLLMMCIGGKERTRECFEKVLDSAGLRIENVYFAQGSHGFAVVEAVLK